jgi:formamidopyrimidine-DNA glycosylase
MPELPDLTVFASNLSAKLKGKKVKSVNYFKDKRLNVTSDEFRQSICDAVIKEINRSGKEIEFVFSNGNTLFVHLMLSGGFSIVKDARIINFKIVTIDFLEGNSLVINDPKELVTLKLNPTQSKVPDALDVSTDYLKEKILEKTKMTIKAFLIDQTIIRGIGNAYVDEILWQAKISPKSIVGKLPPQAIEALSNAIKSVLLSAIKQIRIIAPEIISGEVRDFLSVHNPNRRQSPTGHKIIKEQIASKTTYYTDEQILYL